MGVDSDEWTDEQLEAALRRLDEMHGQLRVLRTTIPRMIKPLTTPHDTPEDLYRDFARAAEMADKEVKAFRRLRNEKESREVFERAGKVRAGVAGEEGIRVWNATEYPRAFDRAGAAVEKEGEEEGRKGGG